MHTRELSAVHRIPLVCLLDQLSCVSVESEKVGFNAVIIRKEELKAAMERIHTLYVDREEKPVVKAAWWVEYVARNKGADLLRSGAETIPWYQYHHVDIILFLSMVVLVLVRGLTIPWYQYQNSGLLHKHFASDPPLTT